MRALTRRPSSDRARWLSTVGPTVRVLPFDLDALGPACEGATDALVVAPLAGDVAAWHRSLAEAFAAASVDHVVKVSVTGARSPDSDPPPGRFPALHWAGEEALREAGLTTSVIRPTIFMQHFENSPGLYVRGDDRFHLPTGDGAIAFLDCRDVAVMAHALITSVEARAWRGGAYELTGPKAVTAAEIAATLSAVRGRRVEHVDGLDAFAARCAALGVPDGLGAVYAEAREGWFSDVVTDAFTAVVGHEPRSFAAWADDRRPWFLPPGDPV